MSEDQLQADCAKWANQNLPKTRGLLWHCPNGGNITNGSKLTAMGVVAGIADQHLDIPNKHYHGLKLEAKKPGTGHRPSSHKPAQRLYMEKVRKTGYCYEIYDSIEDFKKIILEYLKDTDYI